MFIFQESEKSEGIVTVYEKHLITLFTCTKSEFLSLIMEEKNISAVGGKKVV